MGGALGGEEVPGRTRVLVRARDARPSTAARRRHLISSRAGHWPTSGGADCGVGVTGQVARGSCADSDADADAGLACVGSSAAAGDGATEGEGWWELG